MPTRRSFLIGAGAVALVTPSIVRASSLMDLRGVPLKFEEYVRCDGRVLHENEDRQLFNLLEEGRQAINQITGLPIEMLRRYGGSVEDRTFALPDFSPFERYFGGVIELDRKGDLYITNVTTGEREKV